LFFAVGFVRVFLVFVGGSGATERFTGKNLDDV
jgi:hypothetical protein